MTEHRTAVVKPNVTSRVTFSDKTEECVSVDDGKPRVKEWKYETRAACRRSSAKRVGGKMAAYPSPKDK